MTSIYGFRFVSVTCAPDLCHRLTGTIYQRNTFSEAEIRNIKMKSNVQNKSIRKV